MTATQLVHFKRHRFPAEIIAHAVWLYYRFPLSFRGFEDLLAQRGIEVSFQTVSEWAAKFDLKFAHKHRQRSRGQFSDKWYLDEMVVSIKGKNTSSGRPSMPMVTFSMPSCKTGDTSVQLWS